MKYSVKPIHSGLEQQSLFSAQELSGTYLAHQGAQHELSATALQTWKQQVHAYQSAIDLTPAISQTSLFDLLPVNSAIKPPESQPGVLEINPFALPQQNTQFWRWKAQDTGVSAFYFVIDYVQPLLLYVGETVQSAARWKGTHDCKRYLLQYQQAHYPHALPTQIGIAFCHLAPQATRDRQKIESSLIAQWRSPFNKENWTFWNTPFVQQKS